MSEVVTYQGNTRLIAFHLPQFYPTPENDEWWGKGFTEWTNVTRARPLFRGHAQPRFPADLGFYDLRLPEARHGQAELARRYGIEGFCYWHYWFEGRRMLERPVDEILASGEPDFPFCLAWANHSWTGTWMGGYRKLLIEQTYSLSDERDHARWLVRAFVDPRYLRVGNRPLFMIYHPQELPEPRRMTDTLREECIRYGLPEPYLVGSGSPELRVDMRTLGFDITEFHEPQMFRLSLIPYDGEGFSERRFLWNLRKFGVPRGRLKIVRYRQHYELACDRAEKVRDFPHLPCCYVGWDNSPRRGDEAFVMIDCRPEFFAAHLSRCIARVAYKPMTERIVFINAWNEWSEGMYLEPDQQFGHSYLDALVSASRSQSLVGPDGLMRRQHQTGPPKLQAISGR